MAVWFRSQDMQYISIIVSEVQRGSPLSLPPLLCQGPGFQELLNIAADCVCA